MCGLAAVGDRRQSAAEASADPPRGLIAATPVAVRRPVDHALSSGSASLRQAALALSFVFATVARQRCVRRAGAGRGPGPGQQRQAPLARARRRAGRQLSSPGESGRGEGWADVFGKVVAVAAPNVGAFLLPLLNEQTNAIFLGRTGSEAALAAVGLGNTMQNCCGLSIAWGLLGALDTLVSQAHGAGQERLACAYLQRGRIITTLQLLWIVPVLLSTQGLLVGIGQDPVVSQLAASYNRASAPALFCLFQFQAIAKYLQNQCITTPPMLINLGCSVLHVGWCALFVVRLGLGNAGAGLANAATWTCQWLLISLYVVMAAPRLGLQRRAVLGLQADGWRDWPAYLRIAVPCLLQTSSEWWFWEACALIVGYLGTVPLAAHVAALQFVTLSVMPAIGISASAAALVGNALGSNDPRLARRIAVLCILLNLAGWLVLAGATIVGRSHIASIYTRSGEVLHLLQDLLVIYAFAGIFDTTQNVMAGVLRGMGRAGLAAAVYVLAYYGLMLPMGCFMAFKAGHGVRGLWWAFGLGTSVATLVFGTVLCRTRFGPLAERVSQKMRARSVG